MTYLRDFCCDDLLSFNAINLDPLTETYAVSYYLMYLSKHHEYFTMAASPTGANVAYIMGKAEGKGVEWHGHVTAVTVAPTARRMGLAKKLMDLLEHVSEHIHNAYFVDLFVRQSNDVAIGMYTKLGYVTYRKILNYYQSGSTRENAFDMRKALPRDKDKQSMVPLDRPVDVNELYE
mmetsp:Transcript_13487/g.38338  ORF Transcript_13487/g.38338 Transcript_13487/m.38338 type:complete len:177 (-) Transcript_13487:210-740(-)